MSAAASRRYINRALTELAMAEPSHTLDHVEMYLKDALIWLPDDSNHEARPAHPDTQIGRLR